MGENWPQINPVVLEALVTEVNALRAELAEARADRDQWQRDFQEQFDRAEAAEARLTDVTSLCDELTGKPYWSREDALAAVRYAAKHGARGEGDRD